MVRRMRRLGFVAAVALLASPLAACNGGPGSPAEAAQRLLAAAAKDDRAAFEAVIDREAVRDDLRRQMVEVGQQAGVEVDGGPSDFALDRMISPEAVKLVHAGSHEPVSAPPSPDQVAGLIKPLGAKRACVRDVEDEDRCLLTFAKAKTGWRLVGMQAMDLTIPLA
jgi:hypothetical protein